MEYKLKHVLRPEAVTSILCTTFSPTGLRVAAGSNSGRLDVWSVDGGVLLWTCEGHVALLAIRWLASPCEGQDERIFCGYADGTLAIIQVIDVRTPLPILSHSLSSNPLSGRCEGDCIQYLEIPSGLHGYMVDAIRLCIGCRWSS